ncbi:MAG: Peptide methionine sulfoxide reductase MsrA, partial [Candidatus Nomurabacteria bacterium GW2011_GWA1_35_8]
MCGIAGIYFNKKKQKTELESIVSKMVQQQVNRGPDDSGIFDKPIVTEIKPLEKFWPAEENQKDFYKKNP